MVSPLHVTIAFSKSFSFDNNNNNNSLYYYSSLLQLENKLGLVQGETFSYWTKHPFKIVIFHFVTILKTDDDPPQSAVEAIPSIFSLHVLPWCA